MSLGALKQIKTAIAHLNPEKVRGEAERKLSVGLVATGAAGYAEMEDTLLSGPLEHERRLALLANIYRAGDANAPGKYDLALYEQGIPCPTNAFTFYRQDPERTVREVLAQRPELHLALAHRFPLFRKPVIEGIIVEVSKENAMFALATALPDIIPNLIELPWAVTEFASDTLFMTANQIRMAFLIAAACGKPIGYSPQKIEVGSIVASAFGWRTLARELVGKIPLGGGLIPKGAIAFAGTYVMGVGLEKFHSVGEALSRPERRAAYNAAYQRGKAVVGGLVSTVKKRTA